jgi:hypothetical protein
MKWKKVAGNTALVLGSCAFALLLCEVASRIALDSVDYLSPTLQRDNILGMKLPGKSGGHDAWGFRNKKVPETAEIVALGDSHTYGNCAKRNEAWPAALQRLTGQQVYNLGMGGYGPNQYYYLFQTRALSLKPKVILCGFYMGDDFDNAYRITYGLDYWSYLRHSELANVDPDIWEKNAPQPPLHKRMRNWLAKHSVVYKLVVHNLLQGLKGRFQVENASRLWDDKAALILPDKNIREAFVPQDVLRGLDQQQPGVREGMRISFQLLNEMNAICSSNHIQFIVAVIPVKEAVFARYLEHNSKIPMSNVVDQVIANARVAQEEMFEFFKQHDIRYVDLLPALEKASEKEKIYTYSAVDMHPNKNGYRVIAETLAGALVNQAAKK